MKSYFMFMSHPVSNINNVGGRQLLQVYTTGMTSPHFSGPNID